MTTVTEITPSFSIAGQLLTDDFARLAALGFRAVINNRPDGEDGQQLSAAEGALAAAAHGLSYVHIPATKHDIFTDEVIGRMADALVTHDGPVLAYCKSGQRSAIAWAAASARTQPVADVLDALSVAGLDLAFLRDELDKQADRTCWTPADTTNAEGKATQRSARAA